VATQQLTKNQKSAIMDDYFMQKERINCPVCGFIVTIREDGGTFGNPPNMHYTIICKKCVYFELFETAKQ
jgi:hypothetical protein